MCVLLLVLTKFESLFWDTLCLLSHWEEALGDHFEVTGNYLSKNFMLFLIFKSFEVYFGTPCVLRSSEGLRRSSWGHRKSFGWKFVSFSGFLKIFKFFLGHPVFLRPSESLRRSSWGHRKSLWDLRGSFKDTSKFIKIPKFSKGPPFGTWKIFVKKLPFSDFSHTPIYSGSWSVQKFSS